MASGGDCINFCSMLPRQARAGATATRPLGRSTRCTVTILQLIIASVASVSGSRASLSMTPVVNAVDKGDDKSESGCKRPYRVLTGCPKIFATSAANITLA